MKAIVVGCAGLLIGLAVGILAMFAAVRMFQPQAALPTATPTLPPAVKSDVTLTVSAAYINSQVQQAIRQSGVAKQATVKLASPNIIQAAATVEVVVLTQKVTVNATTWMRVSVKNGRIVITVDKVDTDNVAVPQSLLSTTVEQIRAASENQINLAMQRALQGTSLRLANVRVTPSELTVDFVAQ
jgi:hypothetical protein